MTNKRGGVSLCGCLQLKKCPLFGLFFLKKIFCITHFHYFVSHIQTFFIIISLPCLSHGTTGITKPDEYFALFLCGRKWSQQALYTFLFFLTWNYQVYLITQNANKVSAFVTSQRSQTDANVCGDCIYFKTFKWKAVVFGVLMINLWNIKELNCMCLTCIKYSHV